MRCLAAAGESYRSEQYYGYGTISQNSPAKAVLASSVENSTTYAWL